MQQHSTNAHLKYTLQDSLYQNRLLSFRLSVTIICKDSNWDFFTLPKFLLFLSQYSLSWSRSIRICQKYHQDTLRYPENTLNVTCYKIPSTASFIQQYFCLFEPITWICKYPITYSILFLMYTLLALYWSYFNTHQHTDSSLECARNNSTHMRHHNMPSKIFSKNHWHALKLSHQYDFHNTLTGSTSDVISPLNHPLFQAQDMHIQITFKLWYPYPDF